MATSALQQPQAHLRHALAELFQAQPVPQQRAVQHCKDKHREQQRVAHGGGHVKAALGARRADVNHHRVNAAKNANGSASERHAGKRDHAVQSFDSATLATLNPLQDQWTRNNKA